MAGGVDALDRDRIVGRLAELEPAAARAPETVRVVRAPGRVNLIGEHTDYNDGYVLPVAIGLETWIASVPTDDRQVTLFPADGGEPAQFDLDSISPRRGAWSDYVAGTAWAMGDAGIATRGVRGLIDATLPREAGLSSSASLELAVAWSLSLAEPPSVDGLDLARVCQRAENDYVGVQCGLMDQFAVACGQAGAAVLLDCRSLESRAVALPGDVALVVCHTGSSRRLGTSEYNTRREQCESSVRTLAERRPDVRALRDVSPDDLAWVASVVDQESFRRCRHVVTENARVAASVAALEDGDLDLLGRLFAESHASLRDDYEVSSAELDLLVGIAVRTPGVVAARMTGAGFGGCSVNLVRPDGVDRLRTAIAREYPRRTGLQPTVLTVAAVAGAGLVRPRA